MWAESSSFSPATAIGEASAAYTSATAATNSAARSQPA